MTTATTGTPKLVLTEPQITVLRHLLRFQDRSGPDFVRWIVDLEFAHTSGGRSPKARATNWHATYRMTLAKLDRAMTKQRLTHTIDFSWNQVERTLAVCRYWQRQALTAINESVGVSAGVARKIRKELPGLIALFAAAMERDPLIQRGRGS